MNDMEKKLIKLWSEGLTGGQISIVLGCTRNAVMGRLKRLRDAGYVDYKISQARVAAVKKTAFKRERKRLSTLPNMTEKKLNILAPMLREEELIVAEPVKTDHVKLIHLTSKSCRYIVSGNTSKEFLFCNVPKKDGSSYCPEHHKLCYIPMSKPKYKVKRNDATA